MRRHRTLGVTTALGALLVAAPPAAAAPANSVTEHNEIEFTVPDFVGPCNGEIGTLTFAGVEVFHSTSTARAQRFHSTLRATFSLDFENPAVSDVTGHFVRHRRGTSGQPSGDRFVDHVHSIAVAGDGTSYPVHTRFTVVTPADGGPSEVKVDSTRCAGELIRP